jgi:hypothetical protein
MAFWEIHAAYISRMGQTSGTSMSYKKKKKKKKGATGLR